MTEVRLFQLDSMNRKLKFDIAANVGHYTAKLYLHHEKENITVLHKCLAGININPCISKEGEANTVITSLERTCKVPTQRLKELVKLVRRHTACRIWGKLGYFNWIPLIES
jgi:hypothetical protein